MTGTFDNWTDQQWKDQFRQLRANSLAAIFELGKYVQEFPVESFAPTPSDGVMGRNGQRSVSISPDSAIAPVQCMKPFGECWEVSRSARFIGDMTNCPLLSGRCTILPEPMKLNRPQYIGR